MTYEERLKIVRDILGNTDWRSGDTEVDYGQDGGYEYYPCLSSYEIDPIAEKILAKLGLGKK